MPAEVPAAPEVPAASVSRDFRLAARCPGPGAAQLPAGDAALALGAAGDRGLARVYPGDPGPVRRYGSSTV